MASFIVAGLVGWALAGRVYLMCGEFEGFCDASDLEAFGTAGELIYNFVLFGTGAIVIGLLAHFRRDPRP